jgi:uncharacterized protein (DUF2141 family)
MTATTSTLAALAGALLIASLGTAAVAQTCERDPSNARLLVVVDGIRDARGTITASLYTNDGKFLKSNGSLKVWRAPAHAGSETMCVWLPGPGVYAVAVYQDVNANKKIDHNLLGPTEPWGFTNNPHALFALPSFGSVRFTAHAGDNTVHIKLNNP